MSNLVAFGVGVLLMPTLLTVVFVTTALSTESRRWLGCGVCTFWTTSLYPIPRRFQWWRHQAYALLLPAHHEAYGRAHPPRREPEDRDLIPTDLLLSGITESADAGTEKP